MRRWLSSVIDVRKGEVALTLLMFFYYYLLLVAYYFLKPARDSLFLVKLGPTQLPIVFMLIAVVVVPVTTIYSKASGALKLNRLINITTLILIINLVILRWLLEFPYSWVFYVFYIWVSIYGALSTSQFWLLANGVFDATQAKRLFVLFGLGGIIGAFTGGEVTGFIVKAFNVSTENLLFFCMAFLGACILLVNAVWSLKQKAEPITVARSRAKPEKKESYAEIFRTIKRSRHLLLIVGIIAMTMATASFVDYQFKTISVQSFTTKQDLTSFLGKFYGRLSLISFLFPLLISYRFLRMFGVGGAILLLPLGLLGASIYLIMVPGLVAAVLLRGSDGVFKYSIDKTGRELLFLPVPLDVKKRTKVFIDIFVDRWFRGFAGAALLLFVSVFHFSVRQLSFVVLALLVVWLFMVFLMRKEYVNAFRKALERREIDLDELRVNIAEASTISTLRQALSSANERQIVYSLEMLAGVQDSEIAVAIKPLLHHDATDVRMNAIRVLKSQEGETFLREIENLLDDPAPAVRREAMAYICAHAEGSPIDALKKYLQNDNVTIRSAAIGCIAEYGRTAFALDEGIIDELLRADGPDGEFAREELAEAFGVLNRLEYRKYLLLLLDDPSPAVTAKAMRSAGLTGDRDFVPQLIDRLSDRRYRQAAREALALYGDRIVGTLADYIIDSASDLTVRSQACRVLGRIPSQHSVDALVGTLADVEPEVKYHVIKALNRLHALYPSLTIADNKINGALVDETESYYAILQILQIESRPGDAADKLLAKALHEKLDQNLERIFRLLGLCYTQKDIHGAYIGLTSEQRQVRASAVEFLDNVLKKEVKKYLFPIVDNVGSDFKIEKGRELFGLRITDRAGALEYLIRGTDPWLKACAVLNVSGDAAPELRSLVKASRDDPHPVVQETAHLVLR